MVKSFCATTVSALQESNSPVVVEVSTKGLLFSEVLGRLDTILTRDQFIHDCYPILALHWPLRFDGKQIAGQADMWILAIAQWSTDQLNHAAIIFAGRSGKAPVPEDLAKIMRLNQSHADEITTEADQRKQCLIRKDKSNQAEVMAMTDDQVLAAKAANDLEGLARMKAAFGRAPIAADRNNAMDKLDDSLKGQPE